VRTSSSSHALKRNRLYELASALLVPLLLILIVLLLTGCTEAVTSAKTTSSGMMSAWDDIKGFMNSVSTFFSTLSSIVSLLGFKTIALLIAVLMLSSGFSAIGVPKGRISFFLALAVADAIWILFKMSFGDPLSDYLSTVIKSTLIVSLPFLAVVIIKKIWPRMRSRLRNVFARFTGHDIKRKRDEVNFLLRMILSKGIDLHNDIQENMEQDSASTGLSSGTIKEIHEIKKLLDALEKTNKQKKIKDVSNQ